MNIRNEEKNNKICFNTSEHNIQFSRHFFSLVGFSYSTLPAICTCERTSSKTIEKQSHTHTHTKSCTFNVVIKIKSNKNNELIHFSCEWAYSLAILTYLNIYLQT